jgi:hypothetical protein
MFVVHQLGWVGVGLRDKDQASKFRLPASGFSKLKLLVFFSKPALCFNKAREHGGYSLGFIFPSLALIALNMPDFYSDMDLGSQFAAGSSRRHQKVHAFFLRASFKTFSDVSGY